MKHESLEQKIARVIQEEILLVPYDPSWPQAFETEKKHLLDILPGELLGRIEHFGSTAVPGLLAKPVIDMLVEVTCLEETKTRIAPILEAEGYDYFWRPTIGDDGPPFYAWFIKRSRKTGTRTHHIHMVEKEFDSHWDRLYFRDLLRTDPEVAAEYATLKENIAQGAANRVYYTQAKTEFVQMMTERAKKKFQGRAR